MTTTAPSQSEIIQLFIDAVTAAGYANVRRGYLGKATSAGQYTFDVPGRPHWCYVRVFRGDVETISEAINMSVQKDPNIPILIGTNIDGEPYVIGPLQGQAAAALSSSESAVAGPHMHRIGTGLEYLIEALRIEPGLVKPGSGTTLDILPCFYRWNGTDYYFSGGPLDISEYEPASNKHAWIKIGVDPTTNTAVAVKGTEYAYPTVQLLPDMVDDISFSDYLPFAGVKYYNGQTSWTMRDLTDCRLWVSGSGSSGASDAGLLIAQDGSQLSISSNEITVTGTYHTIYSSGATDLNTINGGTDGQLLLLVPNTSGGVISITSSYGSGGNIIIPTVNDRVLDTPGDIALLFYQSSIPAWILVNDMDTTDKLAAVSSNDTMPGYLNGKLVAGTGITLTENNDGGNETLAIGLDDADGIPIALDMYMDQNTRDSNEGIHGFLRSIATAQAISSGTPINTTVGTGKVLIVVNAGTDTVGTITVTGTTIDRTDGTSTPGDTDDITIDGLTTDSSDTDAQSNTRWAFTNAYITSKWFSGAITLSTTDVDLSDVDIYLVLFEQFNDQAVTLEGFDFTGYVTNASAWMYAYLYSVTVDGDTVDISREASLEIPSVNANQGYRRKISGIDMAIDGTTDGIFAEMYFGRTLQVDWQNINLKVWASRAIGSEITRDITFDIDGGGSAITTGLKGFRQAQFSGTIVGVWVLGDQSGSIVVDVWKDAFANFPPTDADSITASAPPTLSSAQSSSDETLTGWTTAITSGDVLAYNVDSASTVERVTIVLKVLL